MRNLSNRLVLVFAGFMVLVLATGRAGYSQRRLPASKVPQRPKLVLLIIIDQFRADYLDRFRPQFVAGGFNRLMSGARFTHCQYDYASTVTGSGHATLATGAYPNIHGIIGNAWYDRSLKRRVNCVEDMNTRVVDSAEGSRDQRGASPRRMLGSTLADELRMATQFESKVVSISIKDRGAILPGGRTANAAYWYDGKTGGFVSSTYYMNALPSWVADFNKQGPAQPYCGKPWRALAETPGTNGQIFSEYSPAADEPCPSPKFRKWVEDSPFMNEIELRLARAAVREEKLGQGTGTDLLAIGLSANDHVGHEYGPYSPQVADMTLRTDRDLAAFLEDLDKTIGLQNVWIALSGDHGVSPTPEYIRGHNLGHGLFESKTVRAAVETRLGAAFGEDKWIEDLDIPYVYLNKETIARRQVTLETASEEAARAVASVPGVFAAYSRFALVSDAHPRPSIIHKAFNSFQLERGGDVFFVLQPYSVASGSEASASHGTPWAYDAQVPLLFWGTAFRPGKYSEPCQPVDLAATLAAVLGIGAPSGSVGTPLTQAIATRK